MKITERNLRMAIFGLILVATSIGAMYHVRLVIYGYFILLAGLLVSINYVYHSFMASREKELVGLKTNSVGLAGVLMLVLFFGIQSSHIPFKKYILMAGVVLILPAFMNILEGKR